MVLLVITEKVVSPSYLQAQVSVPPAGESRVGQKALEQSQLQLASPEKEIPSLSIKGSRTVVDPGAGPKLTIKKIEY